MESADASDLLARFQEKPSVRLTYPPISYLKFPPAPIPAALPPPPDNPTLAHPFTIRADWYNALLSANVPITIALVYATIVFFLNAVNARRKYKPWAFSQTRLFKLMVIMHNIFLALYSLWTFLGMFNALQLSFVSPYSEYGLAGTLDSLCKLHGPRGLGSAATYNETTPAWTMVNRAFHLGADGLTPDATDAGRIWNEGLAFYGWLFYLSKFYEVVDTLIILAKGKKSSFLQTYHHAGAMMAMWAGIRYMSPPIWMFVMVNSFIHFIMYTFYLCSAIHIRVPVWFKRTLTTMQITQFVVGASYAFAHLFVKYQSPVTVPYLYRLGSLVSDMPSDVSSVASSALATASAGAASWFKKAALRAAGREGLAENVLNEQGQTFGVDAIHAVKDFTDRQELRYREELQWVYCLDTSGQTFAILLNCIYLAPLTWLFARFFIKAYLQRVERRRSSSASQRAYIASQSGKDAIKGVGRRLSEAFEHAQGGIEELGDDDVLVDGDEVRREMAAAAEKAKEKASTSFAAAKEKASTSVGKAEKAIKDASPQDVTAQVKDAASSAVSKVEKTVKEVSPQPSTEQVKDAASSTLNKVEKAVKDASPEKATEQVKDAASSARDQLQAVKNASPQEVTEQLKDTASLAGEQLQAVANDASTKGKGGVANVEENVPKVAQNIAETGGELTEEIKSTLKIDKNNNDNNAKAPKKVKKSKKSAEQSVGPDNSINTTDKQVKPNLESDEVKPAENPSLKEKMSNKESSLQEESLSYAEAVKQPAPEGEDAEGDLSPPTEANAEDEAVNRPTEHHGTVEAGPASNGGDHVGEIETSPSTIEVKIPSEASIEDSADQNSGRGATISTEDDLRKEFSEF